MHIYIYYISAGTLELVIKDAKATALKGLGPGPLKGLGPGPRALMGPPGP